MKVIHFILPLAVTIFRGLCVLAGNCDEQQYLHDGICCQKCRPGYHLVSNCSRSTMTVCQPCLPGFYSSDFTTDYACKEMNPCNNTHEYIKVPAPENNTRDNVCDCQPGWHYGPTNVCVENPLCPPGEGISDGECMFCDDDTYSETWSRIDMCQPQPQCYRNGFNISVEGNSTHRRLCSNYEDMVSLYELSNHSLTTQPSANYQHPRENSSSGPEVASAAAVATTPPPLSLMSAVEKDEEEMSLNYKLIVVASIVGGGLVLVIVAFVVSEMRRLYRRKKGLIQTTFPRTKNSKGMGVKFADKRRPPKDRSRAQQEGENETEDPNENTPMLVDNTDISVVVWEPIKQNRELEEMKIEELTSNKEERVTCV